MKALLAVPVLMAMVLAACGGTNTATKQYAFTLGTSFRTAIRCVDEDVKDSCFDDVIYRNPNLMCLEVSMGAPIKGEAKGVDYKRFTSICERWEVVREMPMITARSEAILLAQQAQKIADD